MTNEILKDAELEQVTGGTLLEAWYDDAILWKYGIQNYIPRHETKTFDDFLDSVEKAWSKIGITSKISETEPNEYYIGQADGSKIQITRKAACEYVKSNFKKIRGR